MTLALAARTFVAPTRDALASLLWRGRAGPAPRSVKNAVLLRYGIADATWVETGTFLGQTAEFLARSARHVFTIEPSRPLFTRAACRFAGSNVTVLNGTSESVLPDLLPTLSGPVNFWLDGHYSAGVTYCGATVTPIAAELEAIDRSLANFGPVVVLVDDVRLFGSDPGYPALSYVTEWADRAGLAWHIEHDILIMRSADQPLSRSNA